MLVLVAIAFALTIDGNVARIRRTTVRILPIASIFRINLSPIESMLDLSFKGFSPFEERFEQTPLLRWFNYTQFF
jgi:hypothetical protein